MSVLPKSLRRHFHAMEVKEGDKEYVAVTLFLSPTAFKRLVAVTKAEGLKKQQCLAHLSMLVHKAIGREWNFLCRE